MPAPIVPAPATPIVWGGCTGFTRGDATPAGPPGTARGGGPRRRIRRRRPMTAPLASPGSAAVRQRSDRRQRHVDRRGRRGARDVLRIAEHLDANLLGTG